MDNKNTIYLVVGIVAIVVVAAAAYFVLYGDEEEEEYVPDPGDVIAPKLEPNDYATSGLPVFGNANEDSVIDQKDADIIQKIVDREPGYTPDKYKFADTNFDGKINYNDVAIVNDIINGRKATIHHLNYMNDTGINTNIYIKDAKWPIKNAIVEYTSNLTTMKALGLEDKVIATSDKIGGYYDPSLLDYVSSDKVISIDGKGNLIDQVNNVIDKTGTTTLFAPGYAHEWSNEAEVEKATGIDIIRLCESNPDMPAMYASILLMAFMFQEDDAGIKLMELNKRVYDEVHKIASGIKDSDKVLFACGMSAPKNQHTLKCIEAGGKYAFEGCTEDPGQWDIFTFGDWVYKYKVDCFISIAWSNSQAGSFFSAEGPNAQALVEKSKTYENMEVYKNGDFDFVYGGVCPAFDFLNRGYAMYPELYGDLYRSANQEYYEMCGTNAAGEKYADMNLEMVIPLEEMKKRAGVA